MALPDRGGQFPPAPFDIAYREHAIHNAWLVGDSEELERIYRMNTSMRSPVLSGGFFGRIARYFWARQNKQNNNKLHVPAAADIARTSADLLFSQPPTASVPEDFTGSSAQKIQDRLDLMFNSDEAVATYLEAAEVCSALGGTYLRMWWDDELEDRVQMSAVHCDAAIPTWRYNRLVGVTFWTRVLDEDGIVLRHLERHEPGRIIHGLYMGEDGSLGRQIDLDESEATAWAAEQVNDEGFIETDVDELTATYIPNVRPNRRWRSTPGLSQLGRSDFDGLEPVFDALDEAYSSWMRDVDLGKGRLIVDEGLLLPGQRGRGAAFDSEQSVFTPLREQLGSGASGAASQVQAVQFAIRWQEHSQTCAELLNVILRGAGLSSNNFSDSALTVGVPTATEVNSKDRLSERTRAKKLNYWRAGLRPFMATALKLDNVKFGTGLDLGDDVLPVLDFPARSSQSPIELANSLSLLATASAISTYQMVVEQHPTWSKPEIDEEVDRILADRKAAAAIAVPPPDEFAGGDGDPDNEDPADDEDPAFGGDEDPDSDPNSYP